MPLIAQVVASRLSPAGKLGEIVHELMVPVVVGVKVALQVVNRRFELGVNVTVGAAGVVVPPPSDLAHAPKQSAMAIKVTEAG